MDCGPAALTCLLAGFGIPVSYGRLREACQTDVDGTSIDTLEEVAGQLGLDAEQIMVPRDHLLLPEAAALPAIVVVRLASGATHFVVAWRPQGGRVQVMDPAAGRRWPAGARFLDDVYIHTIPVPADAWRRYAGGPEFLGPLRRRLAQLGLPAAASATLIATGCADPSWRSLGALDAATRLVTAVVAARGLRPGREAARVLDHFFAQARAPGDGADGPLPPGYWSVRPAPPDAEGAAQLYLRGAVLVRVRGRRAPGGAPALGEDTAVPLAPELAAALAEPPARPGRDLLRFLYTGGLLGPATLLAALGLAAGSVLIEALFFRGLLDLGSLLALPAQRVAALAGWLLFAALLIGLEGIIATGLLRLGRHLEARLRLAFLQKIPRLGDRYFASRPTSDMAERSHSIHMLRLLPRLGGDFTRAVLTLALTVLGLAWLDPGSAPLALLVGGLAVALPLLPQSLLAERNLRVRTHGGALSRFYLDALLGLVAIRTHGAERSIRREHESLLVEWAHAGRSLLTTTVVVAGAQALLGGSLAAWLFFDHLARTGITGSVLLFVYWTLSLPALGQDVAILARQYPTARNITLRLLEPLGAPEDRPAPGAAPPHPPPPAPATGPVALTLAGVTVQVAGHTILQDVDVAIPAGSHVAIVGPSGAGKSSLVGILLGWHRPVAGQVLVDDTPLDAPRLAQLRREVAWVDPAIQLWNRSFLDNLRYGTAGALALPISQVIAQADLLSVLQQLPDGLQTPLGEGGGLVSGGEGQRVRLGRALLRPGVRLVILDEPFRGLDRAARRTLLARARRLWSTATVLCITHDVGETQGFDRVLVVEGGRVVEDAAPAVLAGCPDSRYRALLDAEVAVREGLWAGAGWRRLHLTGGRVAEPARPAEGP